MTRKASYTVFAMLATAVAVADNEEPEETAPLDELTDMEFLEYLGSWEESDADWLIFSVPNADAPETDAPPVREEDNEREN